MLALCSILSGTYYAQNYTGIIGRSLLYSPPLDLQKAASKSGLVTVKFDSVCV